MALIQSFELTKTFGDQTAVDHVSLSVDRGEVVGFLGPNGAGKSTTMRMITGFLDPDHGRSEICGHDVASDPLSAKQRLGYLPEGAPGYADMTVGDFLSFVGTIRGLSGKQLNNRLAEMVDRINLADTWNKPLETLSKGFKRRVGIAQALIHDPDVLILDEPTDGLDPNQKHEMRTLIRDIAPNKAIVVSTHILEEVEAICSRAVIIAAGKVVADETPDALIAAQAPPKAIRISIAAGNADEAINKVRGAVNGHQIEVLGGTNGTTDLMVDPGAETLDPKDLLADLTRAGISVEMVGRHRPSLEDVFRQITQTQSPN
ncbi:MAG: ABC transporter ATP-binding protein [Pseudomonadota bacterium]